MACGRSSRPAPYCSSSRLIVSNASLDVLRDVDHVDEQPRALEVREELVAEADALARAFDQPRHVGDGDLPAVRRLDRPEHRRERRERVVRDLRLRVRDASQQRRLARVREADERRVGEQLQAQLDRRTPRPAAPSPRSAAPDGSATRSACCRGRPRRRARRARGRRPRARSAISCPSSSKTCVPTGTASSTSSPSAPCLFAPPPCAPAPCLEPLVRRGSARGRAGRDRPRARRRRPCRRRRRPARPSGRTSRGGTRARRSRRGRRRRGSLARSWNIRASSEASR